MPAIPSARQSRIEEKLQERNALCCAGSCLFPVGRRYPWLQVMSRFGGKECDGTCAGCLCALSLRVLPGSRCGRC